MKNIKRNAVIVTVLLFVCLAVYLNWSYNNKWGDPDADLVNAEDSAMSDAELDYAASLGLEDVNAADADTQAADGSDEMNISDYFAAARLTRQQSRDEAVALLQSAAATTGATQEVIDTAVSEIAAMANYSMREAQIENLLLAQDFYDCVVFYSSDSITVAVPAPLDGLAEAAVARITDTIITETGVAASQINIIEIKTEE